MPNLTNEEITVNKKFNANSVKRAFVSAIAISLITLPMMASAGSAKTSGDNSDFFLNAQNANNTTDQEILYAKLQNESRKVCGSTNLHVTGSVQRAAGNEECYQGTLTSAVKRLDNSGVTALHQKS
jgi:UrcA family protein